MTDPKVVIEGTNIPLVKRTWLQRHERIVIVFLVLLVGGFVCNRWINVSARNAEGQAAVAVQQLKDQKAQNQQLADENARASQAYLQIVATLQQQNDQLTHAMASRNTALAKQQATDKTLPLPDLAKHWQAIAGISDKDMSASVTGITVDDAAAIQTVSLLEDIPVLQDNLKDETTIANNNQSQLTEANKVMSGLNAQVSGLNAQAKDADVACKAQIAKVNADAGKSKRNWFVRGVVTGAAIAGYIAFHL